MSRVLIMLSALLLLPVIASAATYVVDQTDLTWVSNDITILVGDTVEWHWSSQAHTVTNGTGAADPDAGTLFDAALDVSAPMFSHTFLSAGDFPYFCRPHEAMGMTGIVRVDASTAVDDGSWGNIKALY